MQTTTTITTTLLDLPDELLLHVMHYLTAEEVCRVARVSWRMSQLADDNVLWARLYQRAYPLSPEARAHPHLEREHFLSILRQRKRLLSLRELDPTLSSSSPDTNKASSGAETQSSSSSSSFANPTDSALYVRWKPLYMMRIQETVRERESAKLERTLPARAHRLRERENQRRENWAGVRLLLLSGGAFLVLLIAFLLLPPVSQVEEL